MLQVEDMSFSYKRDEYLLNRLTFNITPGGVYGLLGKNGSGKSTLLYLLTGLMFPRMGKVTIDGVEVRLRRPHTMEQLYLLPEEFTLPAVSVSDFEKYNAGFYPCFSHDEFERYLQIFELDHIKNLQRASMGQKKKYLVSFALATNTPLLFMDEPTNGLDIPSKSQFRKAIALGMSDRRSIVISTHQVRDLESMIDRVLILHDHSLLLNETTQRIGEKLQFINTTDRALLDGCLFSQFTPAGFVGVRPNVDGSESPLDLEVLFNAIITDPQQVTKLFV